MVLRLWVGQWPALRIDASGRIPFMAYVVVHMSRLALALAITLTGCTTAPTIVAEPYTPPRVDCIQQDTPDVPAWPTLWWVDGPAWAIETLGILEQERALRGREHACLERHREAGVIR